MDASPGEDMDDFRLDRTQFSVVRLTDPDDAVVYWLSRPVEERFRALERSRSTRIALKLSIESDQKNAAGEIWKRSLTLATCAFVSSRLPLRTSDTVLAEPNMSTRSTWRS